jgi:1-acyl-sn-glycerol-3-phosphate acyltransferase
MTNMNDHGFLYRQVRWLLMRWYTRSGWQVESCGPMPEKAVVIAAPHTSNWDLPYTLAISFHLDLATRWVGKKTIFRWPFGGLMRWLGGVSVDRSKRSDTVQQLADAIRNSPGRMHLVIAPEGTRDVVREWKSGFYHIALAANVPLAFGFVDYKRKISGIGRIMIPSGDYAADLKLIQDYYRGVTARYPEQSSLYQA